ncbi:carboxypeptidase-like regulatory domain-containing protein [Brumimicrobium salinarum]|nr:carboxypeptidase-like regulatory domain-containing protein [Brumimicrobium salinarum]
MKKAISLIVTLVFVHFGMTQGSYGDIQGRIFINPESDKPAMFAKVWVERGASKFGADTDETGRFKINAVPTGMYVLNVNYLGDTIQHKVYANVLTDGIAFLKRINFNDQITETVEVDIVEYIDPLISHDFGQNRINSLDIMKSPAKNELKSLIASRNSDIQVAPDGQMMIRGSRGNDLIHYIDGVKTGKVQGIPSAAIGGVTVYTSAIPAKYGDTTGGVIIMETKSYYDLWRAWKIRKSKEEF